MEIWGGGAKGNLGGAVAPLVPPPMSCPAREQEKVMACNGQYIYIQCVRSKE